MTYDTKRLKTFKWLEKLANNSARYSKGAFNAIPYILTIYGSLYATNGIVLAEVTYPEFEHISDEGFMKVEHYCNENGVLLEFPKLAEPERNYRKDIFRDMFDQAISYDAPFKVNSNVLTDALYLFKLYDIPAYMYMLGEMCLLSGHNKGISLRVLMMGMR